MTVDPTLARDLVLDELFDLTLYRSLHGVAGGDLKRVLGELIPVETKHFQFWRDFFKIDADVLDVGRRIKLAVLVSLCRVFGDGAIQLVLEGIEIHGIRKYLAVWESAKGTPLGDAVHWILEDEMSHEDTIVLNGETKRINPERVRGIFLGFNDGCVEILGAVSGFTAAFHDPGHVLMAASSVAVAGAVSMAAGAYVALGSEREVSAVEAGKRRFLDPAVPPATSGEGLVGSAAVVGVSYFVGALIPVLPVLLGAPGLWGTVMTAGVAIFIVSLVLSFLTGMEIKRRIFLNLFIIAAAVGLSSAIGFLARRLWGISL